MIAILKYNAGNTQSVLFALERMGVSAIVTDDQQQISSAEKLIIPGVGEASSAMNYLRSKNLDKLIPSLTQPVLGICLGMQLLCNFSEENNAPCLGIFEDLSVRKFRHELKVPQIGWNSLTQLSSPLFENLKENSYGYFVHSYYAELSPYTIAQTEYYHSFSSALQKGNFYGVQFHPEKSEVTGEIILKNFLNL